MGSVRIVGGGVPQKNLQKFPSTTELDKLKGVFLVPYNWSYDFAPDATDAEILAGLTANLTALAHNDSYTLRGQLIGPVYTFNDKSTDATYETFGYGMQRKTDEGKYIFGLQYVEGGFGYHQNVRTFNNKIRQYKWIFLGDTGNVGAVAKYTTDTQGNVSQTGIQGIQMSQLDIVKAKMANKDKTAEYSIMLGCELVNELNEDACVIATGQDMFGMIESAQVMDIAITSKGTGSEGVYTVSIFTGDGKVNTVVGDGAIEWSAACFHVTRKSTGANIDIDGIAISGQDLQIAVDTGDSDYSVGAPVIISLDGVASVYAEVHGYYSSNQVVMIDS